MIRSYQGLTPTIPASCYVDLSAQVIGDVVLGEHASVWMNAVVRGDVHSIRIGAHSNVQDCAVLHGMRYKYPVLVGDWVTIGHNATVHGCIIEDVCLIGIGATILNNARIGEGSIVAAGAVIPENTIIPPALARRRRSRQSPPRPHLRRPRRDSHVRTQLPRLRQDLPRRDEALPHTRLHRGNENRKVAPRSPSKRRTRASLWTSLVSRKLATQVFLWFCVRARLQSCRQRPKIKRALAPEGCSSK